MTTVKQYLINSLKLLFLVVEYGVVAGVVLLILYKVAAWLL